MYHIKLAKFGESSKLLSYNETELKNQLFTNVAIEVGVESKVYSPPYYPQSNGRTEGFHNYLNACVSKQVYKSLEWDQMVTSAFAAFNFCASEALRGKYVWQGSYCYHKFSLGVHS